MLKSIFIRLTALVACAMLPLAPLPARADEAAAPIHIAVLKGPTGMGAAQMIDRAQQRDTAQRYEFTVAGAPDLITAQLITGELQIAALPTNTIAMLSQKTNGQVQALAVNTLGVLYLLERGDTVAGTGDLAGRAIVSAGRGSTTEAVATRLFGDTAEIVYVSEHAEAVAQAVAGKYDLVLLPEPFVTSLLSQAADFRIALDLTQAWEASTGAALPMGGIAVRTDFAQAAPDAVRLFLNDYAQSVAYANGQPAEAAQLIERLDIMQAAVAENAIPRANIVLMVGEEMRSALEAFYAVLMETNPALIGGALPPASFYYAP